MKIPKQEYTAEFRELAVIEQERLMSGLRADEDCQRMKAIVKIGAGWTASINNAASNAK